MSEPKEILARLNLQPKVIDQIIKSQKICERMVKTIENLKIDNLEEKKGKLIHDLLSITTDPKIYPQNLIDFSTKYIIQDKINSKMQINELALFFKNHPGYNLEGSIQDLNDFIGVDVNYTEEDINKYITQFIAENIKEIELKPNHPNIQKKLKTGLKFANPGLLINCYNKNIAHIKPIEAPVQVKVEVAKAKPAQKEKTDMIEEEDADEIVKKFNIEKLMARDLFESLNTPELLRQHKERTGGAIITRFPPEPNGYLHIGHCKAMRFNFKVASDYNGYTNLRYDDTNPEKESQEFIDKILEGIKWMGYTPKNIFFASDYFPVLYEKAIELIKLGKAYVCFLSKEDSKNLREAKKPSPYRDTSIEENLNHFKLMKAGYYNEGQCCLRAKFDYESPNPVNRDPVMYRIKFIPHPHTGNKWCIYPLYDYAHSISDCVEDITHSLCTLEFENRRDLYYWSLKELNLYRPYVWEYSRLNISHTVLSKRKVIALVEGKHVDGWDDPRILTLDGMKRRGIPAEAINYFCDLIGVTRRGNNNVLDYEFFEHCIRNYLKKHFQHAFAVFDPIELEMVNFKNEESFKPENFGYEFKLTRSVFVDKNDVKEKDQKKFFGIAPGKIVRLRYGPFIRILEVSFNDSKIKAEILTLEEVGDYKKIKGILHWIASEDAVNCEIRDYSLLFNAPMPGKDTGNIMDDLEKNSKKIILNAKISKNFTNQLKIGAGFQFERVGYYAVDYDSDLDNGKYVFNSVVGMKSSKGKKELSKN